MEMSSQGYSQAGCRESSAKLAPSRNRPAPQRCLAHLHSIRLFSPDHYSRSSTDRTRVC